MVKTSQTSIKNVQNDLLMIGLGEPNGWTEYIVDILLFLYILLIWLGGFWFQTILPSILGKSLIKFKSRIQYRLADVYIG